MIKQESRAYFRALGNRVTALRKGHGMTQAELAKAIGVSQQAVFAYELGERRPSIFVMKRIVNVLGTSIDALSELARPAPVPKSKVSPRTLRHAARLQALPVSQQRFMLRILAMLEDSNKK